MTRRAMRRTNDTLVRNGNDTRDVGGRIGVSPRSPGRFSRVINRLAAVLASTVWLVGSAAAQVSVQPSVSVYTLSPGRIAAMVAVMVGLIGAIIGGLALARAVRRIGNNGRRGAIVAMVLAPIGLVIGGLVVGAADGGLGTGHGFGGGVVAMVVGLIGVALGGLALARSRRIA